MRLKTNYATFLEFTIRLSFHLLIIPSSPRHVDKTYTKSIITNNTINTCLRRNLNICFYAVWFRRTSGGKQSPARRYSGRYRVVEFRLRTTQKPRCVRPCQFAQGLDREQLTVKHETDTRTSLWHRRSGTDVWVE